MSRALRDPPGAAWKLSRNLLGGPLGARWGCTLVPPSPVHQTREAAMGSLKILAGSFGIV
eukprot:4519600-Pyramimonas_sp.AAC.1